MTKLWPEDQFPLRHVGHIQLNRNPADHHNEVERVAFGTAVLVDGIDFSEDKLLQGRTFAYSDTRRYRVGPNYLQLPINAPRCPYATNQRGGQMSYHVDGAEQGANPHVDYGPSNFNGLREQPRTGEPPRTYWAGEVGRQRIDRTNDFAQPSVRYRTFEDGERKELISNLVGALPECAPIIQERMIRWPIGTTAAAWPKAWAERWAALPQNERCPVTAPGERGRAPRHPYPAISLPKAVWPANGGA